ncbi:hypothetical protein PV10_01668 [Exophiala mesophila]|uniref:Uncharacterized protein n=1 Tax=Exophiala mesophila TaxID=212818 RepID=A0A0D2AGE4_EXOME|nr:uncharacterized protein PV10_01668 [Exophiala mesophila]KIV97973.1 hypothetical protein PV10_01668 [Exophiala mesophila]
MPRQAHGRSVLASKPAKATKRKATRNRRLNALEMAEEENPEQIKVPRHRLGHVDDDDDNEDAHAEHDHDGPATKRQKTNAASTSDSDDTGSDLEGNRWHVGVDDDDEDSDIDSDDAFGESDEEKFADFTFRGTSSIPSTQKRRPVKSSPFLDEDASDRSQGEDSGEDGSDDDLGDDAVDLATAWDMDDEAEKKSSVRKRSLPSTKKDAISDDDDDSAEGEDDDDDDSDNESQLSVSDDDGDHNKLQSFVEGLSAPANTTLTKPDRPRKGLSDKPSQFGLGGSKLTAADLLQYVKDPRQRQTLKMLQNSEAQGAEAYKSGIPGKLAPPLAKRQQDRLDRSAAYEETKKELDKWIDTVKQNRRAEHISFPLQDQSAVATVNSKSLAPTSQSIPMTSLESTIQAIMEEQGLAMSTDNHEQEFEELQEKQMPLQEVQARRAELRKERDLLFREEIRARRVKKIKSKAYRRIHRKEREKAGLENRSALAELGMIDSEEERERNDRRRAEERMGARHRESKWAKSVKATGRGAWDDEARNAVGDLARRDEELRRRIEGKSGDASGSSEDEIADSEGLSDSDEERDRLRHKFSELASEAPDTTETRLSSMAFMKKAEAARKAANDEEIRNAQRMLGQGDAEDSYGSDLENISSTGRQKFGSKPATDTILPKHTVQRSEFEERNSEDEDLAGFDDEPKHEAISTAPIEKKSRVSTKKSVSSMPPVSQTSHARLTSQTNGEAVVASKIDKMPNRQGQPITKQLVKKPTIEEAELNGYTSSSGSEDEDEGQSTLAQAIFAGPDEVSQDFRKEKKETVEEEGDQVIDNTLPGWGSWTGEGVSKKALKRTKGRFTTTIKGVAADKRKDAKLERVIINEKRIKKNDKYLAQELPHPFETRHQYERSLRLPLGPEWTTKNTFQDATKPRVLMKQGVIRPMARPQA